MQEAILPLKERPLKNILSGDKTIEIRRRASEKLVNIKCQMYFKKHIHGIVIFSKMGKVTLKDFLISENFPKACLTPSQLSDYVKDLDSFFIFHISKVIPFRNPKPYNGTIPQSYKFITT